MLFENLDVWKRSSRLCCDIMEEFETSRNFALKDQIYRSSLSIPSNIAEGEERETLKEKIRFYYYAKGSCGEVVTQLQIAVKTSHMKKQEGLRLLKEAKEIAKILATIIQKDKHKMKAETKT